MLLDSATCKKYDKLKDVFAYESPKKALQYCFYVSVIWKKGGGAICGCHSFLDLFFLHGTSTIAYRNWLVEGMFV